MILPGWITVDAENSRLVGSAGVFSGVTKAAANAAAQAALDAFAVNAIAEGNLACVSDCTNPDDFVWSIEIINTDGPVTATMVGNTGSFDVLANAILSFGTGSQARYRITLNNTTPTDCNYRFAGSATASSSGVDSFCAVFFPEYYHPPDPFTPLASAQNGPMSWSQDFTVPAGGSYVIALSVWAAAYPSGSANSAHMVGTFTIVPI